MTNPTNRTFICSVVFIDIVDYSMKLVDEQIKLKNRLIGFITEAIKNVAVNDRIILDTGDGASIGFLGDPEDALFCSLSLRDAMAAASETSPLLVRIGINLGPVKLVKDINGRPNLIGDGINTAQRVMSFADPGQIVVSRSYYDVVGVLNQEFAQLFHYLGIRSDKHVKEHEIYSIERPAPAVITDAQGLEGKDATVIAEPKPTEKETTVPPKPLKEPKFGREGRPRRTLLYAAGAVVLCAVIVIGVFILRPRGSGNAAPAEQLEQGAIVPREEPANKAEKQKISGVAPAVPMSQAQQYLDAGVKSFDKKDYPLAEKSFAKAKGSGLTDISEINKANKYLAFIYCLTGRTAEAEKQFVSLFSTDPKFALTPAEQANPAYGPVYQKAKKTAGK